ncbi:histidinol-phosphate transaminase [Undibacterium baiyunense]|uniref:Histidinol-phosphate aminotransferase n=1 Tax=Undibacterium baiyunense TaxID=2828731 RepID=A0A941I250_9BURK|nr:histidinol-phosphate transaminase [Undibacterium baiyunense]MBR7747113.1 histidinol-phosphate transaminase [Undibacterium baiyunense]
MSIVENIIRADVRALSAYHVPDATGLLKLDAMENPYTLTPALQQALAKRLSETALNRYPVPNYLAMKEALKTNFGVPDGYDLVLGNGSDELIAMISIACAKPGAKVLAPMPGFVMYAMSAQFAGMEFVGVPLNADFTLDKAAMLAAIAEHRPAITYLAYPNNPTGTLFDVADMEEIISAVGDSGVVIVDEAYQPFAQTSFMSRLPEFSNLVVMRTVSKLGLAGIRLGYMSASAALLQEFDKVRPPYNVNVLTEAAILCLLEHADVFEQQAAQLRAQRSQLSSQLTSLPGVEVFPSAANFLLIRLSNPEKSETYGNEVFTKLLEQKILVKNVGKMHALLQNCLRITVSTPEENAQFLNAFRLALV